MQIVNDIVVFGSGRSTPTPHSTIHGGKGAGLLALSAQQLPVPDGLVVPTYHSYEVKPEHVNDYVDELVDQVVFPMWQQYIEPGKLFAIRSGAPVSMPGMMDTILNCGITRSNMATLMESYGRRTVLDCMRRYLQMMGTTYYRIEGNLFEQEIVNAKTYKYGLSKHPVHDSQLTEKHLERIIKKFSQIQTARNYAPEFECIATQMKMGISAVYQSYHSERAVHYRKLMGLCHSMGTAVVLQQMVFGNRDSKSCSGVAFSRDPQTGEKRIKGEFLPNSQGEDVVSGVRTPLSTAKLPQWSKAVAKQLQGIMTNLEQQFGDMQEVEFTVESGKLYILQTRIGKRSAQAAFTIAKAMEDEGLITHEQAISRVTMDQYRALSQASIVNAPKKPHMRGLPVSNGVAQGVAIMSLEAAKNCTEPYVLLRELTEPEDIKAITGAQGVVTLTGGVTSHAAVVTRSLDIPCVVGCGGSFAKLVEGKTRVTVNGSTGEVYFGAKIEVAHTRGIDLDLAQWIAPTGDQLVAIPYTGPECWAEYYGDLYVTTDHINTVSDFVEAIEQALTSRLSVINIENRSENKSERKHLEALGQSVAPVKTLSAEQKHKALLKIASEWDVTGMYILNTEYYQNSTDNQAAVVAQGYRLIESAYTVTELLASQFDCLMPAVLNDETPEVVAKLIDYKQKYDGVRVISAPVNLLELVANTLSR